MPALGAAAVQHNSAVRSSLGQRESSSSSCSSILNVAINNNAARIRTEKDGGEAAAAAASAALDAEKLLQVHGFSSCAYQTSDKEVNGRIMIFCRYCIAIYLQLISYRSWLPVANIAALLVYYSSTMVVHVRVPDDGTRVRTRPITIFFRQGITTASAKNKSPVAAVTSAAPTWWQRI